MNRKMPHWLALAFWFGCLLGLANSVQGQTIPASDEPSTVEIAPGTVVDVGGFKMIYVPSATYEIGISRERLLAVCEQRGESNPERCVQIIEEYQGATYIYTIDIPAFWIHQYEVTIEQFQLACTSKHIWFPEGCRDRNFPQELAENPDQPQVGVTWFEAATFCESHGWRLPTEDEWEYAASGPEKLIYPWGNEFNIEYVELPARHSTYPVGSISENRSWIGVYDMAGNAAEWVEDRFLPRFLKAIFPNSLLIPAMDKNEINRVTRGGAWDQPIWAMATYSRQQGHPVELSSSNGFRCASSLPPS